MITLPDQFLSRMHQMLGDEYDEFLESYNRPRQYGLRVNTLKLIPKEFAQLNPFPISPIPWVDNGFYYTEETRPAQDPYYAAGLYYLQEPSAMSPASRLPIEPGDKVLDLCAAPGGKATELAARLHGSGILVANDISNSRAKALLHNLELFGAGNIFVTNEVPGKLSKAFEGWFDKVLVDAPCSGEGMFRKAPEVVKTWDPERPEYFAKIQKDIVANGVKMLRPGGMMLYSTCTFEPEENEGAISWLLHHFPEMELVEMEPFEGFRPGVPEWADGSQELRKCVHIWPHCMEGEGHFLALLRKREEPDSTRKITELTPSKMDKNEAKLLDEFLADTGIQLESMRIETRNGKAYLIPELPDKVKGLHFLRNGLYLGEFKKNRFEPSQSWAMALSADQCSQCICLPRGDERIDRYLRGETISAGEEGDNQKNGWKLICVDKFSMGWGKLLNGVIKNKFLCSWRKN